VNKARSIKTWLYGFGVEDLDWSAPQPHQTPSGGLERRLRAKPSCPLSVPDLTSALLDEWGKILTERLQNNMESLPIGVEAVIAANRAPSLY